MANLPITSRVLKACHKGMKVRDPLLKVGTVTKQTTQRVNLNNQGGEAEFQKQLKKSTDLVAGGNVINYQGGGTFKNKKEKDWYLGQIKQRMDSGMSQDEAIQDYRNTFQIGKKKVEKLPDKLVETEKEVDVLTKITPKTQENIGMSNFDARQQGRKSIQNARKLNKFERKMSKYGTFDEDGVFTANKDLSQKDMRKLRQFKANRDNFLSMQKNINTQTDQGSFGSNEYTTDEYRTKNQQAYDPRLKINSDGSVGTESATEVFDRLNPGKRAEAQKNKPTTFFGAGGTQKLNDIFADIKAKNPFMSMSFGTMAQSKKKDKALKKNYFKK